MTLYDFQNKKFALLSNSSNGQVNNETIFHYQQQGDLVTADYSGGSIRYGKIIAKLEVDHLYMLYQCITTQNQLRAGKAIAKIGINELGKMKLELDWEWMGENPEKGKSEYIEIE